MKRLTSSNYHEMDMVCLALNQVYIKDGWTWYANGPEDHLSICDLIRSAAEALALGLSYGQYVAKMQGEETG